MGLSEFIRKYMLQNFTFGFILGIIVSVLFFAFGHRYIVRQYQNIKIDEMVEGYTSEKPSVSIEDMEAYIATQPQEDQERLEKRAVDAINMAQLPMKSWWNQVRRYTPEVRARAFYQRYQSLETQEEKLELIRQADTIPGFTSERFLAEWGKIKKR